MSFRILFGGRPKETETEEPRGNGEAAVIWAQYMQGQNYLDKFNLGSKIETYYRFYEGDQWKYLGQVLQTGGDTYPIYNIIEPTVNLKVATVAMNSMGISFAPQGITSLEERVDANRVCAALEQHFRLLWENFAMDSQIWKYALTAAIAGYAPIYFNSDGSPEAVDGTNLFLADEQESDLQQQPYIIIRERRQASELREMARENGLPKEDIDCIRPDNQTEEQLGDMAKEEVQNEQGDGKCISLLKMWKEKDGTVCFCRTTKLVVFQPTQRVEGLKLYPLVAMSWKARKGSARGRGEVEEMIPNQIEINKNLARRIFAAKTNAFPRMVYDVNSIDNPEALSVVGAPIEVNGSARQIQDMIQYLQPQAISNDVRELSDELISRTQELHNAGDAALGSINPEQASGAAIVAAKTQAEIPLNWQKQAFKQMVEDIGRLWYALTVVYNPNGLHIYGEDENGMPSYQEIGPGELERYKMKLRVDVSSINPVSKLATEQALENFLQGGLINFEEYVDLLDEGSNVPKAKLQDMLKKRQEAQAMQATQAPQLSEMPQAGMETAALPQEMLPQSENAQESQMNTLAAMMGV